jgi:2-polyprenyl-3-methyl-5-hydroxy-6-metoxy-1,4-benzoquinol methylase
MAVRHAAKRLLFPIPARLARNHLPVTPDGLAAIEQSVRQHYHKGWRAESQYSRAGYKHDLDNHVHARLDSDRRMVVPWLDAAKPLKGSRILEIGCGTGSSTIALAEQGAEVVGIDLDADALQVANDRCRVYGVPSSFYYMNASAMAEKFRGCAFDTIIYFAPLEHMTIAERLDTLQTSWAMLPRGGQLVIVETPNRLWYYDGHTSMLPFYHWLPNELAFRYSSFSPRENFRELYSTYDAGAKEHFLRQGRGASFHEFDLAIGPVKQLRVVSSQSSFHGWRYKPQQSRLDRQYKRLLQRIYPGIHEGFYDDTLFLVLEKQ